MTTTGRAPNTTLRTWRETHHLTREAMANALNNTTAAQRDYVLDARPELIARWENGRTRWPSRPYQAALRDLTGHDPTDLGFTKPSPPHRIRAKAPDLTTLAAELRQRGYTTHLATSPPYLTVRPGIPQPTRKTTMPTTPTPPEHIHQAITTGLAGTGLHVTTPPAPPNAAEHELHITNPARPDRGTIHISLTNGGFVSWEHPWHGGSGARDYYGHLEGTASSYDDDLTDEALARPVPLLMIIHLLTATTS